jgi:hypothetical protein
VTTPQEIAEFMSKQGITGGFTVRRALEDQSFVCEPFLPQRLPAYKPQTMGAELVELAEFKALNLGTALGTPDGELIAKGVGLVFPPLFKPEYDFAVAGLTYAAQLQQQLGRQKAGQVALGVVLATGFFASLTWITRKVH